MLLLSIYIIVTITTFIYTLIKIKAALFQKNTKKTHLYKIKNKNFQKKNKNYQPIGALFTQCEKNFYRSLLEVIPEKYIIFGKVRIADILEPAVKSKGKEKMKLFYKICAKHIDYVICHKKNLNVVCCVELHDNSHNNKERQERDNFVRAIFKGAKINFIEIKATRNYNANQLKKDFKCIM